MISMLVSQAKFSFETEDTAGPAYTQMQIQHRPKAPGPP